MKPYRSKSYLKWVKSLRCVASACPAQDAHHLVGYKLGGMGTKPSDMFVFPLTREQHTRLHNDPVKWEQFYGKQIRYVGQTLYQAVNQGV